MASQPKPDKRQTPTQNKQAKKERKRKWARSSDLIGQTRLELCICHGFVAGLTHNQKQTARAQKLGVNLLPAALITPLDNNSKQQTQGLDPDRQHAVSAHRGACVSEEGHHSG